LVNGKMKANSIFINVASYNEEDLFDTISTAFGKASFPENIYVGACLQYTDNEYPDFSLFPNVKTIKVEGTVGVGLGIARGLASTLYDNEQYYLQIDAHTVFKSGWDSTLIKNYNELNKTVDKPIISSYVPYYYKDLESGKKITMAKNEDWEGYYTSWSLVSKSSPDAIGMQDKENYYNFAYNIEALDSPAAKIANFENSNYEEQYFVSGHFLFTSGSFVKDVKYDPLLAYHEENAIAMIAWTRGYRIFNMKDHVLWTRAMYAGEDSQNSWKRKYTEKDESGECFRDKVIRGTLRNKDILTGKVIGEYGAPTLELLNKYESAAKVNYKEFYALMYDTVEKTGDKYFAAKQLYDLDRKTNG